MGKLLSGIFMTLDGVVEAPGSGDTTLPDKRGWSNPYMSDEIGMEIFGQMQAANGMLLGRKTYDGFAAFWPNVPADDPFGQAMNGMKKYVVSNSLDKADWNNTTVIKGNVEAVQKLKQSDQNLSVVGSGTLVNWLIQQGLLDELQILLCPVVLGVGKKLFKDGNETKLLKLVESKGFDTGMVLLKYAPA